MSDGNRASKERDVFQRCMSLVNADDPGRLLTETLELLRDLTQAERGYIELTSAATGAPTWSASAGVPNDEVEAIRSRVSTGIVAAAMETGETLHIPSAALDARFQGRESVRIGNIEAVLCVPLSCEHARGVVYLQNHRPGGAFGQPDVACVEMVASFVSGLARQLLELIQHREREDATREIRGTLRVDGIVGRSPALAALLKRLAVVATFDSNVLLTGPSGTGKSLLAKTLHDNSRRSSGPFVALNCAAFPETLLERELFGAEAGAFTGATRTVRGQVDAAQGGTLFLDEVGELSPAAQAKLLSFLQSKTYYRVGGTALQTADVRLVAATNRDLPEAVHHREFREDLYFRLRGVELRVASLAERPEDIPLLAAYFCEETCRRNNVPILRLSAAAQAALAYNEWPGNVRELAHRCEEGVVNARMENATQIEIHHLFGGDGGTGPAPVTFSQARADFEKSFISAALEARDWNVSLTARELELSRSHLNSLIRRYRLQRRG